MNIPESKNSRGNHSAGTGHPCPLRAKTPSAVSKEAFAKMHAAVNNLKPECTVGLLGSHVVHKRI
jgi:hypothetical protein